MKPLTLIVLLFIVSCPPLGNDVEVTRVEFSFVLPTSPEHSIVDSVVVWHGWEKSIIDTLYAEHTKSEKDTVWFEIDANLRPGKNDFLARAWIVSFGGGRPLVDVDYVEVVK